MELNQVLEGVYKGMSPAINEERLYLEIPQDLTDDEVIMAFTLINKPEKMIAHDSPLKGDFDKKCEEFDGKKYMRCGLGSIDEEVQKFQQLFTKAIQHIRENNLSLADVNEMIEKKEFPAL